MSIPNEDVQRAVTQARVRESQGYFTRVRAGDQRAASLFVRLVAGDLNPSGKTSEYGWLSKSPGETQVDGFAEDAICWTADSANRENVVDLVNGAGAPGASIGGAVKERREHNRWVRPQPLTAEELLYLQAGGDAIWGPSEPPTYPPYPGDAVFDAVGVVLFADYAQAEQAPNPQMGRWFGRVTYDWLAKVEPTLEASIVKHRREWRAILGLQPL